MLRCRYVILILAYWVPFLKKSPKRRIVQFLAFFLTFVFLKVSTKKWKIEWRKLKKTELWNRKLTFRTQNFRFRGVIVGLLGPPRWCGRPFRSNYQTLIVGLLPLILWLIFRLECPIFGAISLNVVTVSELSIRVLSCIIRKLVKICSENRAIFEGRKITFD